MSKVREVLSAIGLVRNEFQTLSQRLAELKEKRRCCANAPLTRDEMKRAFDEYLQGCRNRLVHQMGERLKSWPPGTGFCASDSMAGNGFPILSPMHGNPLHLDVRNVQGALAPFLRDVIGEAIDTMTEWPEGLPQAKRPAELAKLDKQIAELEAELRGLTDAAQAANLRL